MAMTFGDYVVGDAQCIFLGVGFLKLGIGGNQLSNIGLVGRSRVDVELGGIGSVVALESYFLISAAYVKGFLILHGVFLTVYSNHSVTAGIDDTQFAAFEEVTHRPQWLYESCLPGNRAANQ